MNRVGIYYAFLAASDEVDWHDCLERAARAEADILECSAPKLHMLSKAERGAVREHAGDLGLALTMATALRPDADLSSDDPRVRAAGVELLKRDIDLAAELGAGALGGILTAPSKSFPEGIEYTRWQALDNCVCGLKTAGEHAASAGVTLGLEVANRFETPLLNTAEDALRLAEAVACPAVGVHLDTFHINIEERSPADAIRMTGKRLVHFHACENNRALPGQAHIDWQSVFAALREIGYSGAIVIEALPGPYGSVASRLNIWRTLCENVDDELKEAIRFLRGWMED